ncbi:MULTISPECIES: nucleoside permease [Olivibacter]|jgi:nucleoside transporter|uniref:Nucleoside:proton symporter n=3 Tax=Sphingobacteriaceae TaxID=84566 RepID=F4C8A6_SPHS2|nr:MULTISPECIES: nucleoside permease [Olivibacter]MCL4638968.1 nucleoside permease [Olivibacter sp. UJ_SKK_5.1]MDX3913997.1 nucleoside permease [Pseudosphingobacterium sp.]QEL02144.1 MFS transporter [Olivibacter sp. LS-1]
MNTITRAKLSFMMFLEFFIWGAWFVTLGTFLNINLNASGLESANVFSTQSFGAIIAPFIIGLIADRYFNAERILGVLHLIGAFLMYQMYSAPDVSVFYPYVLAYMIGYMPTLALVNSVSFRQMQNPEKEFSSIRVWGTIGWIIAGLVISYVFHWDSGDNLKAGALKNTFLMAGIASLVLGLYSFILPKTPPVAREAGEKSSISEILGLDALKLLNKKDFLIFFISAILICIPLAFYYQNANPFLSDIGLPNPTGKMAIGQISEAFFLLLLPVFFSRFGFKKTILFGMLAWAIRYALFAYGNANELSFMLIIGIALHGICYDFFFVSGQIYTDARAGEKYKSSAQGLVTLATYGVGMLIGFWVAGFVTEHYKAAAVDNLWQHVWIVPASIAAIIFVLFALFFKEKKEIHAISE